MCIWLQHLGNIVSLDCQSVSYDAIISWTAEWSTQLLWAWGESGSLQLPNSVSLSEPYRLSVFLCEMGMEKKKGSLHGIEGSLHQIVRLSVLFSAWCVLRIGAKCIEREGQWSAEMSRNLLSSQQGPAPRFADFKAKDEPHLAQGCWPACQVAAWQWLSIIFSYLPSWSNTSTLILFSKCSPQPSLDAFREVMTNRATSYYGQKHHNK